MALTKTVAGEYERLWGSCTIRPQRTASVDAIVDRLKRNRARYQAAGERAGVPWYVVGIIHNLESSGNFATHLHNGDPLSARTVHVPAGRPARGNPPFTWEESAADALALQKLNEWKDWSVPGMLYVFERYNGLGYRNRGVPSPYLWSFSSHYERGKFVADGRYSATAVSEQCGAAVVLRRLVERGLVDLGGPDSNGSRSNGSRPGRTGQLGSGRATVPKRPPTPATEGILLLGSRGPAVAALKKQLLAWYEKTSPGEWARLRVSENDVFGAGLDKAVRRFQAWAALTVDGEVGPQTLAALNAKPVRVRAGAHKDLVLGSPLQEGSSGEKVRLVQGWLTLHGIHVVVDGGFGPATKQALRAFQAKRGLPTTGTVDEATYAALVAPMAAALAPIPRKKTLGELVLAYAKQHLEQHPREVGGQNRGPWVRLYTDGREGDPYPWCAGFATFCIKQACETLGVPLPLERTLACDTMATSCGHRFVQGPGAGSAQITPGSMFVQRATGSERQRYRYRHTGIVVSAGPDTMQTIEGNTNDDGSAEGYEVCARTRGYRNMDFIVL
jgi:lysozyme family protein/peptidoglycan hydrolase-like protein with peptidoglycan-binding domain